MLNNADVALMANEIKANSLARSSSGVTETFEQAGSAVAIILALSILLRSLAVLVKACQE